MLTREMRNAASWVRLMLQGGPLRLTGYQAHEGAQVIADTFLPGQISERGFPYYHADPTPQGGLEITVNLSTSALLKTNRSVYDAEKANLGSGMQQEIDRLFKRLSGSGTVQLDASVPNRFVMRLDPAMVQAASQESNKASAQDNIGVGFALIVGGAPQRGAGRGQGI